MQLNKEFCLGIDIGGTNTAFGLVDREGNCIREFILPTEAELGPEALLERLFKQFKDENNPDEIHRFLKGIGIGAPNGNYFNGFLDNPPNLPWGKVDLVNLVHRYYDLPVRITNDANAAALGEMRFGAAKGMKHFIEITLGTGLGSGIVVNGQIVYGHDGYAGEMGHVTVVPDGRICNCGKRGCLETYASAEGIKRTVMELLTDQVIDSRLRDISFEQLTSKKIYELALENDPIAVQAFDHTARLLGRAMADAAAYLSPQAFILFGGLVKAGDLLFKPLKKYLEENLLYIFKNKIRILPSGLPEAQAAIIGAAALIWYDLNHF